MKNRITLLNMISSFILQIVSIISGFIIPKLILKYFGSEVNGLVSSLNQFLSYITLIEGGVSSVIVASLYKPLVENNKKEINSIIKTADSFYKKIGIFFIGYTLILAIIYPLLFDCSFSYEYVFGLTCILSISLFIQYMFSLTYRNLLNADKKVYIVSITQTIIIILNIIGTYISVKLLPNIHILKLISSLLFILQPIIFNMYIKKHYSINKNVKINQDLLSARWNGFAINIAAFIHNCTDIAILTIFTDFSTVSVYSVYALVASGIKQLINSLSVGINPTIGKVYVTGNFDELNEKMNLYEYIILILVFLLFTVSFLLITPFVLLYTNGLTDANYNQPLFGILILVSEALYLLKYPHLNLAYSAGKFKEITKPAFVEAFLNIFFSIIFVIKFGLIGVTIGTIIAMTYRMIFQVNYVKKVINNRKQSFFYKKIFIFCVAMIIGVIICVNIPFTKLCIKTWLLHASIYFVIFSVIYYLVSIMFFKNEINYLKKYIFKNKGVN